MPAASEGLEPPTDVRQAGPGATQHADHSDSEDHFTDAQSAPVSPGRTSPLPKTPVEHADDNVSHDEAADTDDHKPSENGAIASDPAVTPQQSSDSVSTPDGDKTSITVVEETPSPVNKHSDELKEKDKAETKSDVLAPDSEETPEEDKGDDDTVIEKSSQKEEPEFEPEKDDEFADNDEEEPFGDDFDDFEEGGGEEDDFDDFDDGFQQAEPLQSPQPPPSAGIQVPALPFPIPDFEGLDPDSIMSSLDEYLTTIFPPEELDLPALPPLPRDASAFTTSRSASLWSQLVAPPPLAPPDWIRSRTRRLFLVSLGVPVDLDEILPASKQKKLVLPSLNLPSSTSPRTSHDSRSVSRLREEANASSTSVDTQGKPKKRRGPSPQPDLDIVAARHLCTTTDEALNGLTDEELKSHVTKLEALEETAKEVLEYWKKRTDEKIAERETFEGVIENLVKHARKVRK